MNFLFHSNQEIEKGEVKKDKESNEEEVEKLSLQLSSISNQEPQGETGPQKATPSKSKR